MTASVRRQKGGPEPDRPPSKSAYEYGGLTRHDTCDDDDDDHLLFPGRSRTQAACLQLMLMHVRDHPSHTSSIGGRATLTWELTWGPEQVLPTPVLTSVLLIQ